ncbi:MAG: hypothetical protein ACKVT0_04875 [Planctomycetaceae bacterium]
MVEFIRTVLRGFFKLILFIAVSGLAAAFIAGNFADPSNENTVFIVSWVVIGLLLFAFPEIWKWLNTPV